MTTVLRAEIELPAGRRYRLPDLWVMRSEVKDRATAEAALRSALALSRHYGRPAKIIKVETGKNLYRTTILGDTWRDPVTDKWSVLLTGAQGTLL